MVYDIRTLLKRFEHLQPPERSVKEDVKKAVLLVLGIHLKDVEMSVNGKQVFITTSPSAKSEIMLHKADILKAMRNLHQTGSLVKDIR
ncbi:MAG: hypothetical protein WDZ90_02695 [Candidatus Paceibacterota bacterium]